MKDYKSIDELCDLAEQKFIVFNNDDDKLLFKSYLEKFSYNALINPYKILCCTSIDINGSHKYENPEIKASSEDVIKFFEDNLELNCFLFKHISLFEHVFSSSLTKAAIENYDLVISNLNDELAKLSLDIYDALLADKISHITKTFEQSGDQYSKEDIIDMSKKQLKTEFPKIDDPLSIDLEERFKYVNSIYKKYYDRTKKKFKFRPIANLRDKEILDFFTEKTSHEKYAYFHGSLKKVTFGKKKKFFELLPEKQQQDIMKELKLLGYHTGKFTEVWKFTNKLKIILELRNKVYHINSLAYYTYRDTREKYYNLECSNLEKGERKSLNVQNSTLYRVIDFLNLENDPEYKRAYKEYTKKIVEKTLTIYNLDIWITSVQKKDVNVHLEEIVKIRERQNM